MRKSPENFAFCIVSGDFSVLPNVRRFLFHQMFQFLTFFHMFFILFYQVFLIITHISTYFIVTHSVILYTDFKLKIFILCKVSWTCTQYHPKNGGETQ